MFRSACQHMTRAVAVFALALLCAQTLAVAHDHDHDLPEHELCAVCGAAAESADSPALVGVPLTLPAAVATLPAATQAPADGTPASRHARSPPSA